MMELANPPQNAKQRRTTLEKIAAEFHQRLATPLLPLTYVMIGLAAILAGEFNRRGMNKRLVVAAIGIIIMQALMLWLVNLLSKQIWLTPLIYIAPLIPAVLAFALLKRHDFGFWPRPVTKAEVTA